MRRFSVRSLMAFILVCAIGLAALRNANDMWAGAMLFVVLPLSPSPCWVPSSFEAESGVGGWALPCSPAGISC